MAQQPPIDNVTCRAFEAIEGPEPNMLLRFIVGQDTIPQPMTPQDMGSDLGDPFATLLLARGTFPTNADELLAAIDQATSDADPLRAQRSFVLGEDGQLGLDAGEMGSTNRSVRFLVARGSANHGPELIISASHPQAGLVEVMAWDTIHLGFNYYRTLRGAGGWVWAGNSRHALRPPTRGKGPFESHPSGSLIMKELRFPWVHWDSFKVHIPPTVFDEDDIRREHPWFVQKSGAETCEIAVVMPSIVRWTNARLERFAQAPEPGDVPRIIEHIATSPTVNLASSSTESAAARLGAAVDLPPSFFVDTEALQAVGLPAPPSFAAESRFYVTSLEKLGFRLTMADFSQRGDTHFAFVVPERAFEDNEVLRQTLQRGIISRRLAATILMVDFPNPVFSRKRARLLTHVPDVLTTDDQDASDAIAGSIVRASEETPEGSPERDFALRWGLGDDGWETAFANELTDYYAAIQARVSSQEGFDDFVRVGESRRNEVRDMPIGKESPLLFPETDLPRERLSMTATASVVAEENA